MHINICFEHMHFHKPSVSMEQVLNIQTQVAKQVNISTIIEHVL